MIGVVAGVFHEWRRGVAGGAWVRWVCVAGDSCCVVVCEGVSWVRVGDIRYVILGSREEVRVGARMGGEVGDEAMEEGDVVVAVSGGVVGSWRWCECWRLWW